MMGTEQNQPPVQMAFIQVVTYKQINIPQAFKDNESIKIIKLLLIYISNAILNIYYKVFIFYTFVYIFILFHLYLYKTYNMHLIWPIIVSYKILLFKVK